MTDILSSPLLPAILTTALGICIFAICQYERRDATDAQHAQTLRVACSGLLLVSLGGVQFGLILLDSPGWTIAGAILLLASIPMAALMAIGAIAPLRTQPARLPHVGPWDDATPY